jgi:hypothetical protein
MKNDGWSMGMGTHSREDRRKKRKTEMGMGVKVTGYLGVCWQWGKYELLDTSFLFPSLCVFFSFSFVFFDVILARFDPPKRVSISL